MHEETEPCCVLCAQPLTGEELEQCQKQAKRFDHQLLCFSHQRRFCGCPGVRNQPRL